MGTLWFAIVAVMLTAYVVLDGFDIGAGAIHLLVGSRDEDRRTVLRSIGPVWDGNEVWLLAAGGTLYFAFPQLYASAFSGFYLPLMMVLWLLMLRGLSIELRTHLEAPVWRTFFDSVFAFSSILLAIFYGAALGNVVRGVPLNAEGYFFEPLWTDWRVGPNPGILDWYTVLAGLVALASLTLHGALYVAVKTEGIVHKRSRAVASYVWPALLILTFLSLVATMAIRPELANNYKSHPISLAIPLLVFFSLAGVLHFLARQQEKHAFTCSCLYLVGMLVGAVYGVYPNVLPATTPANSLTIQNSAAGHYGLTIGLVWWVIGMALALGYFFFIYRMFAGKVKLEEEGY